jgi:aryl-alcohol dehydrogenase-like predicted oxidoreductase
MSQDNPAQQRRQFLQWLAGLGAVTTLGPGFAAPTLPAIQKTIPVSGESLPAIGMGSWLTFDVGDDEAARATRVQVLQVFFDRGGALIDSSPMYGSSQEVIGYCLRQIQNKQALFAATKVWIYGQWLGIKQMEAAQKLWGVARIDLMQIHNMLDWQSHLDTLKAWKAEGRIRYIGITTSHGRRHQEMERALLNEPFDFVQFTYNLIDREAEQRLLPLAAERGIAVIVNRPFQGGALFGPVQGKPLPAWAADFDCTNWAQFFLKYIVAHPAVTCAIPATSRVAHMHENMGAGFGRLPDAETRRRMLAVYAKLAR